MISWKPIKDLLRTVINKREDGTDIRPQEGNPGTVHVWPEAGGLCGYAMGTLQKRKHAFRALRTFCLKLRAVSYPQTGWLGGNSWYGRPLSVILYYDDFDGLQYVDSCFEPRNGAMPIKLEDMVAVGQKELVQRQPSRGAPNMLLCQFPKGSTISHPQVRDAGYGLDEGDRWSLAPTASWAQKCRMPQDFFWRPSEMTTWTEDVMPFSGIYQPCPVPYLNMLPVVYPSAPVIQACGNNYQTAKPMKWKHRQRNSRTAPSAGSARPLAVRLAGKPKDELRACPGDVNHVSSSRPSLGLNASNQAFQECMRASECAERVPGPVIADGSEVSFGEDDDGRSTKCLTPTSTL